MVFPNLNELPTFSLPWEYIRQRFYLEKYVVLSGTALFTGLFLICEPVTMPDRRMSRIIYGAALGIMTYVFRVFSPYECAACCALLIVSSIPEWLDLISHRTERIRFMRDGGRSALPIQQNPNKRRGEDRSETLIIPHITREMLEVARAMAEKGASRAEIEAAIAAMQTGKAPAAPAAPAPEKQPGAPQQPAPGRSDAARSGGIIPTSRPRYTAAERRAMLEEVQRRQAEREAAARRSPGRGGSVPQLPGPGVRQGAPRSHRPHVPQSTPARPQRPDARSS